MFLSFSFSLSRHVKIHQLPLCVRSEILRPLSARTTHVEDLQTLPTRPPTFNAGPRSRGPISISLLSRSELSQDLEMERNASIARFQRKKCEECNERFHVSIASGCFEVVAYLRELAAGRVNNQGKRDGVNPIGKPAETNIQAWSSYPARV